MRLISLLMLLPSICFGQLRVEEGEVLPFKYENASLSKVIGDFAAVMNKLIVSNEGLEKKEVFFSTNSKIKITKLEAILDNLLNAHGYSLLEENGFLTVFSSRDSRYAALPNYDASDVPTTERYVFAHHVMKYPFANSVSRGLRPFMSRYGRIVSFSDGHTITISDTGKNVKRLMILINSFDTKEAYNKLLHEKKNRKKIKKPSEREKLELEILKLEKAKLQKSLNVDDQSFEFLEEMMKINKSNSKRSNS